MKNRHDDAREGRVPPWAKAAEVLRVLLWDIWVLPWRWDRRLKHLSFPVLLTEIENDLGQARLLSLSPRTIARFVRLRKTYTLCWRHNRCLLSSLLLLHCLARTQREITLHLECRLEDNGQLAGHSWISGPGLEEAVRWMPLPGSAEIYRKTIDLRRQGDPLLRKDYRAVAGPAVRKDCTPR